MVETGYLILTELIWFKLNHVKHRWLLQSQLYKKSFSFFYYLQINNNASFCLDVLELTSGRFGHDQDFNGFAEGNGSLDDGLRRREAVDAVAPSQLGGRRRGGAVGEQEAHLHVRRL